MKLVLFGTGEDSQKCMDILRAQEIEPDYFTDNDSSKWGRLLGGKKILSPQQLLDIDCRIIISTSDYQEKILMQLEEMGLKNRVWKFISVFRQYVDKKAAEYHMDKAVIHDRESILVDAFMGSGWDGDQQYACYVASGLKERGFDVHVYAKDSLVWQNDKTEELIHRFPWRKDHYWDTLLPVLKDMEQRLPFVLIANTLEHVMAAACILKQKYPHKIKIISVMHNDNYSLYEKQAQWADIIDSIIGISEKIVNTLKNVWKLPEEKILYKINPVFWNDEETEDISDISHIPHDCAQGIQIGWGGRLTASQKNAHLLPSLIEFLEQKHVNYRMEIAGDGSYYAPLQTFLGQKHLQGRVLLLGRLEHHTMREFWKRQQIYINLSEWEGCCLAMLEAMECGTVPVVTDVSGVSDVVHNGQTGFKVDLAETDTVMDEITDIIALLAQNPDKRKHISQNARKIVKEKCDLNHYMDFMETLILSHIGKILN